MNKFLKRTISLLLVLVMVLSLAPVAGTHVHAAEVEEPVVAEPVETEAPTEAPVEEPAEEPTEAPTEEPTEAPSEEPTEAPTEEPTEAPTEEPVAENPKAPVEEPVEEPAEEASEPVPFEELDAPIDEAAPKGGDISVADKNIGLSWTDAVGTDGKANGAAEWSASGSTVIGKATGYVSGPLGRNATTTLTITNKSDSAKPLNFDYTLTNSGTVSANVGTMNGTSGSYSQELAAGGSVVITLTSPKGKNTATLTLTNLQLVSDDPIDSTFLPAENGSYTVDGEAVTATKVLSKKPAEAYALKATPDSGYVFFGWYSQAEACYVSRDAETTLKFSVDPQLKPVFVSETTALFGVGQELFADLTEAGQYAANSITKTIVLLNNGTVSGSHTIPAGVTLLVPFDDANTLYTDTPVCTSTGSLAGSVAWVQPTAYRTLTLASDAKITVDGAISISGKHAASNGGGIYCGAPTGPVGWVKMERGSNITLNDGSFLYAWGFVQGSGTVLAKSGSTVYENFQFTDFRGGSFLLAMVTEMLVFPINQYYVQNIEVPTTYEAGAAEKIYASVYASGNTMSAGVTFMGPGGMFTPTAGGTIVKDYIESEDRLELSISGGGQLNSLSMELSGIELDSSLFVLPINSNIRLNLNSGTTTINQSVSLLPGVEMNVAEGATLEIVHNENLVNDYHSSCYGLIVYDADEWTYGYKRDVYESTYELVPVDGYYAFQGKRLGPVGFAPGRTYTRTEADLKDVKLDINGKLICNGFLYTTKGGANIISSKGTGSIEMVNGAGYDVFTFQANEGTALMIPMNTAQLRNGDGTYLNTGSTFDEVLNGTSMSYAPAGSVYNYCDIHDKWYLGNECDACLNHEHVWSVTSYSWSDATCTAKRVCQTDDCRIKEETETVNTTSKVKTPATCTENGWTTYTASFTVSWATTQTKDVQNIPALNHAWGEVAYTWNATHTSCTAKRICGNDAKHVQNATAVVTSQVKTPASCSEDGWTTYTATFAEDWAATLTKDVQDIPATGEHNYIAGKYNWNDDHTACTVVGTCGCGESATARAVVTSKVKTPATCTEKGWTTYTATFAEKWAATQTKDVEDIPAKGHAWAAPTYSWEADGSACSAKRICGNDANHVQTATAVITSKVKTPATCTVKGWTTYTATFSESWATTQIKDLQDIPVADHAYVAGEYIWGANNSTCYVSAKCKDCPAETTAYAQVTSAKTKDETCYTMGETTYTATFAESWAATQKKTIANIPATGDHVYEAGEAVWNADYSVCKVPGKCATAGCPATTEATATSITSKVTKDPFCGVKGETTYTATFAESWVTTQTKTVANIDALVHEWGTTTYSFAADGSACTAKRVCVRNCEETANAVITSAVKIPATCQQMGTTTYTATFAEDWAAKQTLDVKDIALDFSNHVSTALTYKNVTATTHDVYHACCDTLKAEKEAHNYGTEHKCACGHIEQITVNVYWTDDEPAWSLVYDYGTETTIPVGATPEGHTFQGYAKTKGGEVFLTKNQDGDIYYTYTESIDLYPVFTVNNYELSLLVGIFGTGDAEITTNVITLTVPYGTKLADQIPADVKAKGDLVAVDGKIYDGAYTIGDWINRESDAVVDLATATMPASDLNLEQEYSYTGWYYFYYDTVANQWSDTLIGTQYVENDRIVSGWKQIDGSWYCFSNENKYNVVLRVEGIARVAYPEASTGLTYGPNAEDIAYAEANGINFIDKDTGLFVFGADGKLDTASKTLQYKGKTRYSVKGLIQWHPGLVKLADNDYRYFIGDSSIGGNYMATGDVYVTRDNSGFGAVKNGIYTFGADGKLCLYDGIIDRANGTKRYYEDAQLILGAKLVQVGENYIYLTTNGNLVLNKHYWVGTNDLGVAPGYYRFDANGFMVNPKFTSKDGVYFENGAWVYYELGLIGYNKGLIDASEEVWHDENGEVLDIATGNIYVRTNGHLATGFYYITNVSNYDKTDLEAGNRLEFNNYGVLVTPKNGIVSEGGTLYYYKNNLRQYNAGVIKLDGNYYYVRSNGEVVHGRSYWITNVGDSGLMAKQYIFDANGVMQNPEFMANLKQGVVDGFYYVDGMVQYGAGVVAYQGGYIYVRSNGQVATGTYWATNTNGLIPAGMYNWGADGILYL